MDSQLKYWVGILNCSVEAFPFSISFFLDFAYENETPVADIS